ncbi:MAG: hypothetical protein EP319_05395 [Deltaproteobacteria bacterium]|nr:MAG: hypothetical protein EP319_05395 [Deltaproteobacteria bacterium]
MICFICPPLIAGGLLALFIFLEFTISTFMKSVDPPDLSREQVSAAKVYHLNNGFTDHFHYKETG